ncbi:MAG: hypothetical protein ACI8ZM_000020 [Crocinitomix sp.]|jgi:hypothetical protein
MGYELHAKTYYNTKDIQSGDEHYITIPNMSAKILADISYSGTGWQLIKGTVANDVRPTGGYLNVYILLSNCFHEPLENAALILTCSVSYWGSPPSSGWGSVTWTAVLMDTEITIKSVTN